MIDGETVPLDLIKFDDTGRAIISDPQIVSRLRHALLRGNAAFDSGSYKPISSDAIAVSSVVSGGDSSPNDIATLETIVRIRNTTFPSPVLVQKVNPDQRDPNFATARLRFEPRQIFSLGPLVNAETPVDVRARIEHSDFSDQVDFAGRPYASALAESTEVTRYVLERFASVCKGLFGLNRDELTVSVSCKHKEEYRQLQGAHIDWTRGTEFLDSEWEGHWVASKRNTFLSIQTLHSLDCVLGGPPTDFFLGEQLATVRLQRNSVQRWIVSALEFANLDVPQPGLCGELLFRPAYTIHQFPSRESWVNASERRLFVSCDFRG